MTMLRFVRWLPTLAVAGVILLPVPAAGQEKPKKERDVIARDELVEADAKFTDLYQAVLRLRPHFLARNRGPRTTGIRPPAAAGGTMREAVNTEVAQVIYLDGAKVGAPDALKGFRPSDIEEVRYLNPNKAAAEFGHGHDGGAILVKRYKPMRL